MWDTVLGASALVLLVAAMGGRVWASVHLAGRKNEVLVTGGPYRYVRNPLYLFSFLGFVGAGLAFESITLGAVFALVFFLSHWPEILAEERRLRALFGAEYERYRRQVPRMVPWRATPDPPPSSTSEELVVDVRRFRLALRDSLAIPLVVVVAEVLEWAKLAGLMPVLVHLP